MALNATLPRPQGLLSAPQARLALLALALVLLAGLGLAIAQVDGERGIAVISASSDIDVAGIKVDVTAESDEEARRKGWQEAVRKGWAKIGGPALSDGQLLSLVSAVVIEQEQLGGNRYIATLGITFDRQRAGGYLGGQAQKSRSGPMLLIPVTLSGGSTLVYEQRNPWQKAWAEYQAGTSRIDYVRPSGAGSDSLLVTYGQTTRPSRAWWNTILDQFGAADILVPIAELHYQYPGGPVQGTFTARYGPDNTYLDQFTMTAPSPDELPQMLSKAVLQFDQIFTRALEEGKLRPDPTLSRGGIEVSPIIQRLIEASRASQAAEAGNAADEDGAETSDTPAPAPSTSVVTASGTYVVQFVTPDGGAFDATLSGVRATPGVRGIGVSSTAIGGTSVMQVTFAGSLEQLAAALRARGFNVTQGSNALRISR
jgi:hypothetical protein